MDRGGWMRRDRAGIVARRRYPKQDCAATSQGRTFRGVRPMSSAWGLFGQTPENSSNPPSLPVGSVDYDWTVLIGGDDIRMLETASLDRKSTRLNSSHLVIS